jgi:hypothetical protein
MVATNDVVSVVRLVRVITATMVAACRYRKDWQTNCLAILELMARELKPLLKTFGRPLGKELAIGMDPHVSGIVLKEWKYLCPYKPAYVVCYSDVGWVLVRKPDNAISYLDGNPCLLADIIGDGIGGVQLFIDACAHAVEELFWKRREQLDDLEQGCLLRRMYEASKPSMGPDMLKFVRSLSRKGKS